MTARRLLPVFLALAACDVGRRSIVLDHENACPAVEAATLAQAYAVRGRSCGDCACGGCVTACTVDDGSCLVACPGTFCDADQLDDGVLLFPYEAGDYAVIVQYVSADANGVPHIVGGACTQVSIQRDGTESSETVANVECCAP
jgi:hypothetical protein